MTTTVRALVPSKTLEATQTTQYTVTAGKTTIDKCTATNYSASPATVSINLVNSGDTAGNQNLITKTKTLAAGETYTFPEVVGHSLEAGQFISAVAGTASAVNFRVSGREFT